MSVKFVIVGAPRTGSTLLVKTLNSIDGVCCHGELLNVPMVRGYEDGFDLLTASKSEREARVARLLQERDRDPVGFIQRALSGGNAATGFKALYHALLNPHWSDVTQLLLAIPDIKFIHLTRHNSLRRYVSERILQAGGPNHSGAGGRSDRPLKVDVDIDTYLQRSAEVAAETRELDSLLSNQDVLDVSYEALSADTVATVLRVCQFLGLGIEQSHIVPALKKVGSADLRDTVSNYQELIENDATKVMATSD